MSTAQEVERDAGAELDRGDARRAADLVVRAYGAEVFGLLVAVHGQPAAADLYGAFAEALVRSMPSFRRETSFRTWAYLIARSVSRRHFRDHRRRRALFTPLSHHPSALEAAADAGAPPLGARLATLRARLSADERELLALRLDRSLRFRDIALIHAGRGASEQALARREARLRKRFQAIRERLRAWAVEATD